MKSCGACLHFARLERPSRYRDLVYTGVCADPSHLAWGRTALRNESMGKACSLFLAVEERAREVIEEICAEEGK